MTPQDDSASDSDSKEKPKRHPTSSEIFFTPEERQFRKQYKMIKSEFCLKELWKRYNRLVLKSKPFEEGSEEMGSIDFSFMELPALEDPSEDIRQAYLARKYRYLQDGIAYLIHCPEKPYLLLQKSRELDSAGRRLVIPRAIKATRPEVFATTAPPFEGTVAYTKQWINVSNLNFEVIRARAQDSTQTEAADIMKTERILKKPGLCDTAEDDIQVDLLDIHLDADGNPIGKRTGHCEWCRNEILPMPTPHVLSKVWDRRQLYCCENYRQLVEQTAMLETQSLVEKAERELIVDVRHKLKPHELASLDPELAEQMVKKQLDVPRLSTIGKFVKEAIYKRKASQGLARKGEKHDVLQDTQDLSWDPYESRYMKPKPFKNSNLDDPLDQLYQHASVFLAQTEVYSGMDQSVDIGDLASTTSHDDLTPAGANSQKPAPM